MSERVEIVVVANDAASQVLRGVTSNFGALGKVVESITSGKIIEDLAGQFIKFGVDSVRATQEYGKAVRDISAISGTSAEDASRLLQVLDDFEISSQDVTAAVRAMTKEGLTPNMETLAKLSDEYLSINDAQARNEFIIKNLGRAGLQWVHVLQQGGDALREMNDNVNKGLILNDQQVASIEEMRLSLDNLNDTWEMTMLIFGTKVIPIGNDLLKIINADVMAITTFDGALKDAITTAGEFSNPIEKAYVGIREMSKWAQDIVNSSLPAFMGRTAEETEDLEKSLAGAMLAGTKFGRVLEGTETMLKAQAEAVAALTQSNEDYLNLVGTLADNLTGYEQKHADIQRQLEDGNITLQEAETQWQQLAAEQEKATFRMTLNMLQQRLAVDGLSEAETAFLLDQGVQWGIYSQTAVDQANKIIGNVDNLVAEYNAIPRTIQTDVITNFINIGSAGVGIDTGNRAPRAGGRAGGGEALAGMLYRVNETRTEYFQPAQNGTVIPLGAGAGSGATVVINYNAAISLGSQREAEEVILPLVENAVRRMQADGRSAL